MSASSQDKPEEKKMKIEVKESDDMDTHKSCKHFVTRKKRYCRITVAKGKEYCGEHLPVTKETTSTTDEIGSASKQSRIPCPLDPKHTVYARNLSKHLKICNAVVRDQPPYIVTGLNAGPKIETNENADFRLSEIDAETIDRISEKANQIYSEEKIDEKLEELRLNHALLADELANESHGAESRKHLIQISAILGYLEHYNLLRDNTTYIEYGAGKGQVACYLAEAITKYKESSVLLIDRASLRHKKDNKLDDSYAVHRIRADISDFDMDKHELVQKAKSLVGMGKHLCGAATDFAIRCFLRGNESEVLSAKTEAFIVALCCHHRCDWQALVGKEFFEKHQISVREFLIMTKMVGWAVCGSGMSRERRKELGIEKHEVIERIQNGDHSLRKKRKEIGQKCKRIIDFARMQFLEANGYQCYLKSYVNEDVTLENICLVALLRK